MFRTFFRRVSFEQDDNSAIVTNEDGNFLVTLPSAVGAGVASVGPAGPQGLPGPVGPRGPRGDEIWSLIGNIVTNNGSLGDYASQDLVFADSSIAGPKQNKFAFEKSTGALRIGAVDNRQWVKRGDYSTVIGHNSSAIGNGAFSLGHLNENSTNYSFLIGKHNEVNGGVLAQFSNKSTGQNFQVDKQKTFIVGFKNIDHGGASYTFGANNKNTTRSSVIAGNSNSITTQVSKEDSIVGNTKSSSQVFSKALNQVFGSFNSLGGKNISSSQGINFVAGSRNYANVAGQKIYGSANRIRNSHLADIHGSRNFLSGSKVSRSTGKILIHGSHNSVYGPSDSTTILGSHNRVYCNEGSKKSSCGNRHLLIGKSNIAGNNIFGVSNSAQNVIAVGERNTVNSDHGMAMGRFALVTANDSIAIGSGSHFDPLTVSEPRTLGIGVHSKKPAITVTAPSFNLDGTNTGDVAIGDVLPRRKLHISEAMRIEPQEHAPYNPSLGDIYTDTSEAICVYAAGAWTRIAGTGSCSEVLRLTASSPFHTNTNANLSPKELVFSLDSFNLEKLNGNIKIVKFDDDTVVETISVTSSDVVIDGSVVTVNFTSDLEGNVKYYVSIDEAILRDTNNLKPNPALDGKKDWWFTNSDGYIEGGIGYPYHQTSYASPSINLSLWWIYGVNKESGFINIYKAVDDSLVQSIEVNSASVSQSASNVLEIDLDQDLEYSTEYYVDVDEGIVSAGHEVNKAIDGKTEWRFTTRASD